MVFLPTILLLTSVVQQEPTYSTFGCPFMAPSIGISSSGYSKSGRPSLLLHSIDLTGTNPNDHARHFLLPNAGQYHCYRIRFDRIWLSEGYRPSRPCPRRCDAI